MRNLSQPTAGPSTHPTDNPTALAAEWILLHSGCEDLMAYEEWWERKSAAVAYSDTWGEEERTEFFYALADRACTEPRLTPTPGLRLTAEDMAHELRRLEHIVYSLDDGRSEYPPYNWIRFADPLHYGLTVGEMLRYTHKRTCLAYGITDSPGPWLPENADHKLADWVDNPTAG